MAESNEYLFIRRHGEAIIVGFSTAYLQTEAVSEKVAAELFKLVEGKERVKMVLSFEGVRFVASSFLAQVIKLHKAITKASGKLRICDLAQPVRDVLRASQLDKLLDIHDNEAAALTRI